MTFYFAQRPKFITLAIILLLCPLCIAATEDSKTMLLTASLPNSVMHVGDDLVVEVITSNPTDHEIYAAEGGRGGLAVELLNESGGDIGLHAMGIPGGRMHAEPGGAFINSKRALRPGSKDHFTWHFKPTPGYVVPGVYKLRVHQRDITSKVDVYSNTVILTVIP
jgi:hypothetical protein